MQFFDAETLKFVGTLLGGGVLVKLVDTWFNHLRGTSKESYKQWKTLVDALQARTDMLEKKEEICNEEVARLSIELYGMRSVVTRIQAGNIGAIVHADGTGQIIEWNPAATALFHWSTEEAMKMNISKLVVPRLREKHISAFTARVKDGGRPKFDALDTFGVTSTGDEIAISVLIDSWMQKGKRVYGAEIRPR